MALFTRSRDAPTRPARSSRVSVRVTEAAAISVNDSGARPRNSSVPPRSDGSTMVGDRIARLVPRLADVPDNPYPWCTPTPLIPGRGMSFDVGDKVVYPHHG